MRGWSAAAALALGVTCAHAQEPGGAPFVTTPEQVVERMLKLAGTGPGDLVVDLGSGDGRIVIEAALRFGARGLGIERDPELVQASRRNARAAGVQERVAIVEGDVLFADIAAANVVTVYLLPSLMGRLQPRLLDELRPGTRIVSHAFHMTGWQPDAVEKMRVAGSHPGQGDESMLYLWIVPAKARGTWRGGDWRLRIEQNFQQIDVQAWFKGEPVTTGAATLRGEQIEWEAQGARFRGRVEGERLVAGALVLEREPR